VHSRTRAQLGLGCATTCSVLMLVGYTSSKEGDPLPMMALRHQVPLLYLSVLCSVHSYLLHLEVINLLLVMCSTQLHGSVSVVSSDAQLFITPRHGTGTTSCSKPNQKSESLNPSDPLVLITQRPVALAYISAYFGRIPVCAVRSAVLSCSVCCAVSAVWNVCYAVCPPGRLRRAFVRKLLSVLSSPASQAATIHADPNVLPLPWWCSMCDMLCGAGRLGRPLREKAPSELHLPPRPSPAGPLTTSPHSPGRQGVLRRFGSATGRARGVLHRLFLSAADPEALQVGPQGLLHRLF